MIVINTLLPVILVIALGYGLARIGFLDRGALDGMNRLVYWIALPALVVLKLSEAELAGTATLRLATVVILASCGGIITGLLVAWMRRLPPGDVGTFVQGAFRGNLAFLGLPVTAFVFAELGPSPERDAAMALAFLVLGIMIIFFNIASVSLLTLSGQKIDRAGLVRTGRSLVRNPLILASVVGLGLSLVGLSLPLVVGRSLEFIGDIAIPAALFCTGGTLALTQMTGRYRSVALATVIKLLIVPAFALLFGWLFDLNPSEKLIALIFATCPTAILSFVLAKQLGGDEAMAAGTVVTTTVLSFLPMAVIIAVFA